MSWHIFSITPLKIAFAILMLSFCIIIDGSALAQGAKLAVPRDVDVGIYVINIQRINDANQTVAVDFSLRLSWNEPNLANNSAPDIRSFDPSEVWYPDVQVLGNANLTNLRPDIIEVDPQGNATYRKRLIGDLTAPLNFSDFPFDQHTLRIQVVYVGFNPVKLSVHQEYTGQQDKFTTAEWEIGAGLAKTHTFTANHLTMPAVSYEIDIRRYVGYYIWKVIVPLAMVVFMSWLVFWISPKLPVPQFSLAATAILSIIAFRFTLGFLVPRLSYFTRLDIFITGVSILVFLTLVETVITVHLATTKENETAALRWDRACRWVFPVIFVIITVTAFWL